MGYLHEGHLSLCDIARQHADFVVMSLFVNPLQFGPGEDLARYPRDLEADAAKAADRGVDLLFAPTDSEMYPTGAVRVRVVPTEGHDVLCGRHRPGHFEGVLTVVAKLFNLVNPDVAVFGGKDLQQALLIQRMVLDLDFATDIIVAPIVREPDGLALSSRNVYLDAAARASALALHRGLQAAQQRFDEGERRVAALVDAARMTLQGEPGVQVQYVELVDPGTLAEPAEAAPGHALAVAAFVGGTRLIDNIILQGRT